jgi:peptide/nickel transport system substrate-binding protein
VNQYQFSRRGFLRAAGGAAVLAAGTGLLAACGGAASADPSGAGAPPPPRKGGTLRAAFIDGSNSSPSVLLSTQSALSYTRARMIWDSLGEVVGGVPQWRIAESVSPNADATQWTVKVRRGITFHSGKPVTAADVAYSLKTFVDKQARQSQWLYDIDFASVRTPDQYTLVLPMKQPNGLMDLILALAIFVFPDGTTDFDKAEGSGPFTDGGYTPGQQALLIRNDHYWDADHGGPYLDQLILVNATESNARMNGLKAGQFDYAANVQLAAARSERANPAVRIIVPTKDLWSDVVINANVAQQPFTDPRITQALHYAVDRASLLKTVALGYGEIGNDLYCKHDTSYDDSLPQYQYDPEKAKSLLAAAGHSDLRLTVRTSPYQYGMLETAAAWVSQAAAAGITVTTNSVAPNDFYSNPQVFATTPLQCFVSPSQPLALQELTTYGSQAEGASSGMTTSVDPLMSAVKTAVDPDHRRTALTKLQEYLYHNSGQVIPIRIPDLAATTSKVYGVKPQGFADYPSFRDAYLA